MWSFEFPDGHVEKYKKEEEYLKRRAELYGQHMFPVMLNNANSYYVQDCRKDHEEGERKLKALFNHKKTFEKGKTYTLEEITKKAKDIGYEGEKLVKWLETQSVWEKIPYKKQWTAKVDV